jgi:hypothetical protein
MDLRPPVHLLSPWLCAGSDDGEQCFRAKPSSYSD